MESFKHGVEDVSDYDVSLVKVWCVISGQWVSKLTVTEHKRETAYPNDNFTHHTYLEVLPRGNFHFDPNSDYSYSGRDGD